MSKEEKSKSTLLDKLLNNASDVIEKVKRPLIRKKLIRAIEASLDDLEDKAVTKSLKLADLRKKLVEKPDKAGETWNDILEIKGELKNIEWTREVAEEEKEALLG